MDDILDNLVNEIDLSAVKRCIVQILGKSFLCCCHIKSDDFSDELSQRLLTIFCFIVLLCSDLTPQNIFESFYIR